MLVFGFDFVRLDVAKVPVHGRVQVRDAGGECRTEVVEGRGGVEVG